MKHHIVDCLTELKSGDFVIVGGKWAEIYCITEEAGIFTSQGNICRTKLHEWVPDPDIPVWIVCAANKNKNNGRIICGARHCDAIMNAQIKASEGRESWLGASQGFLDQYGRFYNRKQAWVIAERNNQIKKKVSTDGTLYSENCW